VNCPCIGASRRAPAVTVSHKHGETKKQRTSYPRSVNDPPPRHLPPCSSASSRLPSAMSCASAAARVSAARRERGALRRLTVLRARSLLVRARRPAAGTAAGASCAVSTPVCFLWSAASSTRLAASPCTCSTSMFGCILEVSRSVTHLARAGGFFNRVDDSRREHVLDLHGREHKQGRGRGGGRGAWWVCPT
jgi:hypothetical protein